MHPFFPDPVFAWAFFLVLAAITAVAAYIDLRTLTIPKPLVAVLLAAGVLFNIVRSAWLGAVGKGNVLWFGAHGVWLGVLDGFVSALVGFLFAFVLFFVMFALGTCKGGDVKLFAALGTWGGFSFTLLLLICTIVFVVLIATAVMVWSLCFKGAQPTFRNYTLKKGVRVGKKGDEKRPRRRLMAYSPAVVLSVFLIFIGDPNFRKELEFTKSAPEPTTAQQGDNQQARVPEEK
jgi:Flp pilus assembly protein protease CpaA